MLTELLRTTNPVLISRLLSLLEQAEIPALIFDQHVSNAEGLLPAFPRRVMVAAEDHREAASILSDLECFARQDSGPDLQPAHGR